MALTASELLAQRMEEEKQQIQTAFRQEWDIVNRRFGPRTNDVRRETERKRALSTLHQQYTARANRLLGNYAEQMRGFDEVDAMAQSGMMTGNPEEIKLRMVLPPEVEKAAFPKEEEAADPLSEYGKFDIQRGRIRKDLERFEIEAPGKHREPVLGAFRRGSIETPGGGVLVTEEQYDEKAGKVVKTRRNATIEEIRQWASLTEEERRLTEAMQSMLKSDPMAARVRLAAAQSPRMLNAGTFAGVATSGPVGGKTVTRQIDPATARAIYEEVGGDVVKARELARQRGFRF